MMRSIYILLLILITNESELKDESTFEFQLDKTTNVDINVRRERLELPTIILK